MSSIDIKYTSRWQVLDRNALAKAPYEDDRSYKARSEPVTFDLSLHDHLFRCEQIQQRPTGPERTEIACDGTWFYDGSPDAIDGQSQRPRPDLTRWSLKYQASLAQSRIEVDRGFIFACGYSMASTWGEMLSHEGVASAVLKTLDAGGVIRSISTATVNNTQCLRVEVSAPNVEVVHARETDRDKVRETLQGSPDHIGPALELIEKLSARSPERIMVWYLDPTKQYAVARSEESSGDGHRMSVVECSDFASVKNGALWLPRRVRLQCYMDVYHTIYYPKPVIQHDFELQDVNTKSRDASFFSLSYSGPNARVREIGDDGENRTIASPASAESGNEEPILAQSESSSRGQRRLWVVVGFCFGGVALVGALGVLYRRIRGIARS